MQQRFVEYLANNCGCDLKSKFLLAVSGGVDSIVMTNLFKNLSLVFGIAHCNFQLRGEESNEDAQLVKTIAKKYNSPFFLKSFDTEKFAKNNKLSIEMAARSLRYEWLEFIRKRDGYDYIATAHHANDVAETMIINLVRGTGINGLCGIPVKNNYIIRPLLRFNKKEILQYAVENHLYFRTDLSNYDINIFRNHVRHQVLPQLHKLNPSIIQTLNETSERFNHIFGIYKSALKEFEENIMINKKDEYKLDIKKIKQYEFQSCFLFETIKNFGFNHEQVLSIMKSFDADAGKLFHSKTHTLLKDREFLVIRSKENIFNKEYSISSINAKITKPISLKFKLIANNIDYKSNRDKKIAYIDAKKLKFPLILRKWKIGDKFIPLGMKNKKKLSDFFNDNKFSRFDKNKIWLLLSENTIIWIVGSRIDDRYKVKPSTIQICEIKANFN